MKKPNLEKPYSPQRLFKYTAACLGLASVLLAGNAGAANLYFDVNGSASGFGVANGGSYSWDTNDWSTSSTGVTTTENWVAGDFPRFYTTVYIPTAISYTVTLNNTESMAGIYLNETNTTLNINAAGSGNFSITSGIQGFLTDGSTSALVINAPITGPGGVEAENGGSLFLAGNNTYSGGTVFGTTGGVNINNNNSFGTGPIYWGDATYQILADLNSPAAPGPLTIANSMTTSGTYLAVAPNFPGNELIVVTGSGNPITFTGPWTNGASGYSWLRMNTAATTMTIAGTVQGAGNMFKDGPGRLILNGADNNGTTFVTTNGVFEIGVNGVFAGSLYVTNTAGQLQLDSTNSLTSSTTLFVSSLSNNAINLNYSGTDVVYSLNMNGVAVSPGTYGAGPNGQNLNGMFTGNGYLYVPPAVLQQPQSAAAFPGESVTFNVIVSGNFDYQWYSNGTLLPGQINSSLTISPLATNSGGTYTVTESALGTNGVGTATLTVLPVTYYTATILSNGPIAYWRLDETSGTTAYDSVSTNNATYVNVSLGQPGFSLTDPDTCIGVPANPSSAGYALAVNNANFNFTAAPFTTTFTLEAWAYLTNISAGKERLISTLESGNGWGFDVSDAHTLEFTEGAQADYDLTLPNNLSISTGVWNHFAMTYDGSSFNFFLNGNYVGSVAPSGHGTPFTGGLAIGSDPPTYIYGPEKVEGDIDEVAIYATALSTNQIYQDYVAHNGVAGPPAVSAPVVSPSTNYVSQSAEFLAVASGQDLSYQWYMSPSTLLSGQTGSSLALSNLALTNSGSYYVQVSNPDGTNNSPATALTVLPIPTNASQLNLVNGLVLHLPFNGNYNDISGNGYNGTPVGSPTFVSPAAVGSSALSYSSDSTIPSYNYVTLGLQSDLPLLNFGSSTNFTVSMWVQQPSGSTFTNLPFFTDEVNSTGGSSGFAFTPYNGPYGGGGGGGWQWSLNAYTAPSSETSFNDQNVINDGNWHNLIFVANRQGNMTTYVDGTQVNSEAMFFLPSIDSGTNVTIGQDPTGTYPVTASAHINDLAVWNVDLSPLQITGLYLAGASNGVSFAPPIAGGPTYVPLTVQQVAGQWQLSWSAGNLQSTTNLGSFGLYPNATEGFTNVPDATSPYTIPSGQAPVFYRLHP